VSTSAPTRQQVVNYYKALEDFSQKKDSMSACWVQGEDQSRVVPTYHLLDEEGNITNPDEFPSEVWMALKYPQVIVVNERGYFGMLQRYGAP
jgi:hypothetical protein